jgi:hypothetical protein
MGILIIIAVLLVGFFVFAMNSKATIFRTGFFKKMRGLFSSPKRAQKILLASETGVISLESMPMDTGYVSNPAEKTAWLVMHALKSRIKETGDVVLTISEKSYIPADPYGRVKDDDIQSLDEVALSKYDEKCVRISEKSMQDFRTSVYQMAIVGCICILVLLILFH